MSTPSPAQQPARQQPLQTTAHTSAPENAELQEADQERARARGAEELRDEVRHLINERRRIVRLGDQQIEVVEVSALIELLEGPGTASE